MEENITTKEDKLNTNVLKTELQEYQQFLSSNPRQWFIEQVKHCILTGRRVLRVIFLNSNQYKKFMFPCISSKKINANDVPYYDENMNILITDKKCRKNIDFIKEVGLSWCVGIDWDDSLLSVQQYTLNVVCF